GGGAKALAAHLAGATGSAVLVEDAQWRNIATAGSGTFPPSARAIVEAHARGHTTRIVAGNTHVGWLSIAQTDGDTDYLMRLTASALAVELARNGESSRSRRRAFWERLAGGAYIDANAARDDAVARGISLAPSYLVVALEAESEPGSDGAADRSELRAIAAHAFAGGDGEVGLLDRGPALLVFVPATREIDASNARTAAVLLPKAIAKRRTQLRLSGGVGRVESLLAVPDAVRTAEAALAIGRRIHGSGHIKAYDELGAYALLYEGADVDRLERFARSVFAPLRAYDEKHQTELERTLTLYFSVGQNVKTAAAQLSVHRHTIFYRLRQIGEICGCSLESPHDQLTLRLAVAIHALHR
ncbi:MAG: helix-turn-helix domain-containing protein, partial [Candidatus Eremiobacteraeota bacterium]|nr:helix-turn-helix domain-containing protein [Candidatus Eremiobacteraeota bacterium]